jgi:5-methylcytosine-specific restriction endonuclease McrA
MPIKALSELDIDYAKEQKKLGKSNISIAKSLGVCTTTIWRIFNHEIDKMSRKIFYQKQRKRIIEAKEKYGNKCSICGYDKSLNSLSFHHVKEKSDFLKKHKHFEKLSDEAFWVELEKCILVCSNCHHEIHDKIGRGTELQDYFKNTR